MSVSGQSVFISYAREDLAAARRIADALKAFEVEVWFDEAGLEGGDAWDQKIRRQIKECSLFIPIISVQTQARREAYFRLEWKLAEERTHLMAEGTAFLLPIAIDDTLEDSALVPESFRRTQWTRLPRGVPNTTFVNRVRALLERQQGSAVAPGAQAVPAAAGFPWSKWSGVVLAVVLLVSGSVWWFRRHGPAAAPSVQPAKPVAMVTDKSVAVLPFENMSDDKENAFFADGIHEDILTSLTNLHDLRVVSRTSIMQYRGTTKTVRQIGEELGVTYLLEGSVRRAGGKVRVTGQLIKAGTDEHLWAKQYDRELTDIFAIQAELANEITGSLRATLSPQESARLARPPTDNIQAYDMFLRARVIYQEWIAVGGLDAALNKLRGDDIVVQLEQAVHLDPGFVAAWTLLAGSNGRMYAWHDHTEARLARARAAIDTATRLAPDDPEVGLALGEHFEFGFHDLARAREQYERVLLRLPGNLRAQFLLARLALREGRWSEALTALRTIHSADARDWEVTDQLAIALWQARRYPEYAGIGRQNLEFHRDELRNLFWIAICAYCQNGSKQEINEFFVRVPAERQAEMEVIRYHLQAEHWLGDAAGQVRWSDVLRGTGNEEDPEDFAPALLATGDLARARTMLLDARARAEAWLSSHPDDWHMLGDLATVLAYLGEAQPALAMMGKATTLRPVERDPTEESNFRKERATVFAWAGQKEEAVRELASALKLPSVLNVHRIRVDPVWAPLRDRPDFQALLDDPKNNAPLY